MAQATRIRNAVYSLPSFLLFPSSSSLLTPAEQLDRDRPVVEQAHFHLRARKRRC
jgi:hypothetical protein